MRIVVRMGQLMGAERLIEIRFPEAQVVDADQGDRSTIGLHNAMGVMQDGDSARV